MSENIFTALNAVMSEVGYVQKTRSSGVNYSFAGEAALIAALRPELVANGVVVVPHRVEEVVQDTYSTSRGSVMNRTIVKVVYKFVHAPSQTEIEVSAIGEGADIGDKSANKAMTGAYKYALRQALMIETGDDPDESASEQRAQPTERKAAVEKTAPATNGTSNGKASDGDQRVWPNQVVTAVANETGLNPHHARAMLNLSIIDPKRHPADLVDVVLGWVAAYGEIRDTNLKGAEMEENRGHATQHANKQYSKTLAGA